MIFCHRACFGSIMISPLEQERNELGYHLEEVRGKYLRVVQRIDPASEWSVFMVHGGGGRAGQFKHLIKALEPKYAIPILYFVRVRLRVVIVLYVFV